MGNEYNQFENLDAYLKKYMPNMVPTTFKSGAVRSEKAFPWWMLPWDAVTYIAARFKKGQDKGYGVHNWKRAKGDIEFIRQLFDHSQVHMLKFLANAGAMSADAEGETPMDHLGAAAWGMLCLTWYCIHDTASVQKAFTLEPESVTK